VKKKNCRCIRLLQYPEVLLLNRPWPPFNQIRCHSLSFQNHPGSNLYHKPCQTSKRWREIAWRKIRCHIDLPYFILFPC